MTAITPPASPNKRSPSSVSDETPPKKQRLNFTGSRANMQNLPPLVLPDLSAFNQSLAPSSVSVSRGPAVPMSIDSPPGSPDPDRVAAAFLRAYPAAPTRQPKDMKAERAKTAAKNRLAELLEEPPSAHEDPALTHLRNGRAILETGKLNGRLLEELNSGGNSKIYKMDDVVIRVFHSMTDLNKIRSKLEQIAQNYRELRLANLPVVDIHNLSTMLRDGYVATSYVPHSFDVNANMASIQGFPNTTSIADFLRVCYELDINADAHNGTSENDYEDPNFRSFILNGPPVLIDFMELDDDFALRLRQAILPSWGLENMDQLDPSILNVTWSTETDLSDLQLRNTDNLFKEIAEAKNAFVDLMKQEDHRAEEFSQKFRKVVNALQKNKGLESLPLSTLRNLAWTKTLLAGPVTDPNDSIFSLKLRTPQGQIVSTEDYLMEKYGSMNAILANDTEAKKDLIQWISNGNETVASYLLQQNAHSSEWDSD